MRHYIGGTAPSLPATTRSAVKTPSELRVATTKTCTPRCRSPDCPGSRATTGMPGGMVIVCEPPPTSLLYSIVSQDPLAFAATVPFVIFEGATVPFVIFEAAAVPLVIVLRRESPGQS